MKTRRDVEVLNRALLVPWYLLASLCYYHQNRSPLTDDAFDYLCVRLDREWTRIRHRHTKVVDRESLKAGTCFLRVDQFPLIVRVAVDDFYKHCVEKPKPVLPSNVGRHLPRRLPRR